MGTSTRAEHIDRPEPVPEVQQPTDQEEAKDQSESRPEAVEEGPLEPQSPVIPAGSVAKASAPAPLRPRASLAPVLPFTTEGLNNSAKKRAKEVAEILLKKAHVTAKLALECATGKAPLLSPPSDLEVQAQHLQSLTPDQYWRAFDPQGQSTQQEKHLKHIYDPSGPAAEVLLSSKTKYEGYTIVERSSHLGLIKELLGTTLTDSNLELTLVPPEKLRKITKMFIQELQKATTQAEVDLRTSALWEAHFCWL